MCMCMYSFLPPSSHSPSFSPSLLLSLPPFLPPSSPPSLPSSANILLNQNWSGVLTDFGIARKLSLESTTVVTQRIVGTRVYMSPEYCTGLVSPSADVYSLGVVSTNISECVCVCCWNYMYNNFTFCDRGRDRQVCGLYFNLL